MAIVGSIFADNHPIAEKCFHMAIVGSIFSDPAIVSDHIWKLGFIQLMLMLKHGLKVITLRVVCLLYLALHL